MKIVTHNRQFSTLQSRLLGHIRWAQSNGTRTDLSALGRHLQLRQATLQLLLAQLSQSGKIMFRDGTPTTWEAKSSEQRKP